MLLVMMPSFLLLALGPCLYIHFWNDAGIPFMLYSSLKPEGYLVTGPEIHLHYVIRNKKVVGLVRLPHKRDKVSISNGPLLSEVGKRNATLGPTKYLTAIITIKTLRIPSNINFRSCLRNHKVGNALQMTRNI